MVQLSTSPFARLLKQLPQRLVNLFQGFILECGSELKLAIRFGQSLENMSSKYQSTKERYKNITSGIYSIVNNIDGKMYIGSAIILQKRKHEHFLALRKNEHANRYLQFAFNKYGGWKFDFKILEIVTDDTILISREQYWMDLYNSFAPNGYNLKPFAINNEGLVHSPETRIKIGLKSKNRKASDKTKALMSAQRKGRNQSSEWIKKRTENRKFNNPPKERPVRLKVKRVLTEKHKKSLSVARQRTLDKKLVDIKENNVIIVE